MDEHNAQDLNTDDRPKFPKFVAERQSARLGPAVPTKRELYTGLAVVMVCSAVVMMRGGSPTPTMADTPARRPAAFPVHRDGSQVGSTGSWTGPTASSTISGAESRLLRSSWFASPGAIDPFAPLAPQVPAPQAPDANAPTDEGSSADDSKSGDGRSSENAPDLILSPTDGSPRYRRAEQGSPRERPHGR